MLTMAVGALIVIAIAVVVALPATAANRDLASRGATDKGVLCALAILAFWPLGVILWWYWRRKIQRTGGPSLK
jgi:hypothetical protein